MKQKINEIEIPDGKRAEWVNGELTLVDDKPKDVTERIKTFEDACAELGDKHPFVIQYKEIYGCFLDGAAESNSCDITAYLKLRIICTALNEGQPDIGKECYYPSLHLKSYNEMMTPDLEESIPVPEKYLYGGKYARMGDHLGRLPLSYIIGITTGSRICFKDKNVAKYAVHQFPEIWFDFLLLRK